MNFRTPIEISKYQFPITYNSKIMSIGSCFAENMAQKFDYFKFTSVVNPFGIIFNAVSIERIVERIVNQELFTEKDIFFHDEKWHCFEVHSQFSHSDKDIFIENLNQILEKSKNQIAELSHFIITYGTSWVYRNLETNQIVANCHKMPQKQFTKELLSTAINQKSIENIISLIHSINNDVKFIFTISPVRHIKDGFFENNVSKANLLTAIFNELQTEYCKLQTEYFPSYEIVLDELRDYRFYNADMLHPTQQTIDYIWQLFVEFFISENNYSLMKVIGDIQKLIAHKPINPESKQSQDLKNKISEKISSVRTKFPEISF